MACGCWKNYITKKFFFIFPMSGQRQSCKFQCNGENVFLDVIIKRSRNNGFRHVDVLRDSAPSQTSKLVKQFLKAYKVTVLLSRYNPSLLFLNLEIHVFLSDQRYMSWLTCFKIRLCKFNFIIFMISFSTRIVICKYYNTHRPPMQF